MAKVVNERGNLPITILSTQIKQFHDYGLSSEFLDILTKHPQNIIGVKRSSYYVINTDVLLQQCHQKYAQELTRFRILVDRCFKKGFQMIMIKF